MANAILFNGGGVGAESALYTAKAEDVLSGYKYIGADTDDDIGTGTMQNNGAQKATIGFGGSVTIKEGYHNGGGVITATNLTATTIAPGVAACRDASGTKYNYYMVDSKGVRTLGQSGEYVRHSKTYNANSLVTFTVKFHNFISDSSGSSGTTTYHSYTEATFKVPSGLTFRELLGSRASLLPYQGKTNTLFYKSLPSYAYPTSCKVTQAQGTYFTYMLLSGCTTSSSSTSATYVHINLGKYTSAATPNRSFIGEQYTNTVWIKSLTSATCCLTTDSYGSSSSGKSFLSATSYPTNGATYYAFRSGW